MRHLKKPKKRNSWEKLPSENIKIENDKMNLNKESQHKVRLNLLKVECHTGGLMSICPAE